ncbi:MAG TPA: hypothetical protein VLE91_04705 [Candidatus Saccharimonadales bacterium]|nr:hypothetical protein [Candidatus Saccharimonadales bacterium]
MSKFLPLVFLASVFAVFGLSWIVTAVDPDSAKWYFFALFVFLLFAAVWGLLGLVLYFVRVRIHRKRYDPTWYFKTSFKMSFFVALFLAISAVLSLLQLVTTVNIVLAIIALSLFAVWSYLGKRDKG